MEDRTARQLTVMQLRPDERLSLPEGATLINSWLEPLASQHGAGSTVVVLVELASAEPSPDAAWERRWTAGGSAMMMDATGAGSRRGEREDTT